MGRWEQVIAVIAATGPIAGGVCAQEQVLIRGGATSAEITVIAPRLIRRDVGRTAGVGTNEQISLTRHVSYADLDLSKPADAQELEKRVNDMAKVACDQLAALYPLAAPNTPDCVQQALSGAMQQVRTAVKAADARR
jgi:UrcA family protein